MCASARSSRSFSLARKVAFMSSRSFLHDTHSCRRRSCSTQPPQCQRGRTLVACRSSRCSCTRVPTTMSWLPSPASLSPHETAPAAPPRGCVAPSASCTARSESAAPVLPQDRVTLPARAPLAAAWASAASPGLSSPASGRTKWPRRWPRVHTKPARSLAPIAMRAGGTHQHTPIAHTSALFDWRRRAGFELAHRSTFAHWLTAAPRVNTHLYHQDADTNGGKRCGPR